MGQDEPEGYQDTRRDVSIAVGLLLGLMIAAMILGGMVAQPVARGQGHFPIGEFCRI